MMPKIHGSGRCGAREPDHAHKVAEDVVEQALDQPSAALRRGA